MRAAEKVAAAYMLGQRDALDAAREAVRNECPHGDGSEWCVFVAAIDALRKEKR